MRNSRLWVYKDDASLGPPVDYHEIRGHLRVGTIRILDEVLLEKVRAGHAVTLDEDLEIRAATLRAIERISEQSGLCNSSRLHYFFWNVFRSICRRNQPQCFSIEDPSLLPVKYREAIAMPACPFAPICASAGSPNAICEHVFESDYY
jgi:hypothetical protein